MRRAAAQNKGERSELSTMMNNKETCKHIEGVTCGVHNCTYNTQNMCTAKEITVGPQFASCSTDTACATFKPQ